jgi:putative ABC transport system permease protein
MLWREPNSPKPLSAVKADYSRIGKSPAAVLHCVAASSTRNVCADLVTRQLPRIFYWHSVRDLRRHPVLAVLNILSIALGVAVYLAVQVANGSANRAFEATVDLIAGKAHLEIRGRVPEEVWPGIARHLEITGATATVEGVVTLPDFPGEYLRILGVDTFTSESFLTFELTGSREAFDFERWMGKPGMVAIGAGTADRLGATIGQTIRALVNGRMQTLTVASILETSGTPGGSDPRIGVMDIGWAQELLGQTGVLTSLLLQTSPGADLERLAQELDEHLPPDLQARTPRQRSSQLQRMVSAFQLNLSALSMVSLFVGVFLVYNTVSAEVIRRRREIGILRAIGASQGEVRALFLGEAFLYGVVGVVTGCAAGLALSPLLAGAVERTISSLYVLVSIGSISPSFSNIATATLFGFAAVFVGAWVPAKEASEVNPVRALSAGDHLEASSNRTRPFTLLALGSVTTAAIAAMLVLWGAPAWVSFATAFLVLVAWALLAPFSVKAFASLGRLIWPGASLWTLASDRFGKALVRNGTTVAALSAAVGMMVALTVMIESFRLTVTGWIDSVVVADLVIAPSANEIAGLSATIPIAVVDWLRGRAQVTAVDTFWEERVAVSVRSEAPAMALLAAHGGPFRGNLPLVGDSWARVGDAWEAGEAVLVSAPFAKRWKVGTGDELAFQSPTGRLQVPIGGVYADYGRDEGVILMTRSFFDQYWPARGIYSVAVYTPDGTKTGPLAAEFAKAWNGEGQYSVYSNRELRSRVMTIFDQTFAVTALLRVIAIAVAVIGIFLSVSTLVLERERETGTLRAIGASKRQIMQLTMLEAAFVGKVASLLGVASGCTLAVVLTHLVNPAFFGWTIQLYWPLDALLLTPVWIVAAAIAAAILPARRAAAINIAASVREE